MGPGELFDHLRLSGFTLTATGDVLRVTAIVPGATLTDDLRAAIREHKAAMRPYAAGFARHQPKPAAGDCPGCGAFAWIPVDQQPPDWQCAACTSTVYGMERLL